MEYKDLPIFKNIDDTCIDFFNMFDEHLAQNNIKLSPDVIFLQKVNLFIDYHDIIRLNSNISKTEIQQRMAKKFSLRADDYTLTSEIPRNLYSNSRNCNITESQIDPTLEPEILKKINCQKDTNFPDITDQENYFIHKKSQGYLDHQNDKDPLHRFVLNATPHPDLYDKLDKFAQKYNCEYKFHKHLEDVNSRPDTFIIYTKDPQIAEQQKELIEIIKPYARTQGDELLDGDQLAPGLFTAPEPTRDDIEKLITDLEPILPYVADKLRNELQGSTKKYPLSLGQFYSYFNLGKSFSMAQKEGFQFGKKAQEDNSEILNINEEEILQPENNIDRSFKEEKRTFFKKVAQRDNLEYKEDIRSPLYSIELEDKQKQTCTSIKIDKNNNLSMGASNSNGENIVPDQKRFNDIADLALQNNQIINFGNIKTPEFKARLLLATMQKGLKTQNAPELTTEFLNSIDKQTRQSLETETYKQRQKELTNGFSVEDTPFKALEETYPDLAKASKFKFKQKDPNKNEVAINATDKNGNYVFSFVINKDTEEYTFQGKLNGKEQSFSSNGLNGMQPLPESVLKAIKNFNGNVMHGHRKIQMQQNIR